MRKGTAVGLIGVLTVTAGVIVASPGVTAAGPSVVINELHYNPADGNPAAEFIELFNASAASVDLSGWCIGGVSFCFPGGSSIAAGGYVVVNGTQYTGALSNGGEKITLTAVGNVTIESVTYDDVGSWPALADGEGHSLQRRDASAAANKPGNWVSAAPSPGAPNAVAGAGLLPSFSDVKHPVLPAAGAPISVTAKLADATAATLWYVAGISGTETQLEMTVAGGVASAVIPGQAAGALVRYRLAATADGRTGTWPRQGDGANFAGTTVARPAPSALPTFEIFITDATYSTMVADLSLSGDDGYPMVFAYQGEVFDNAKIRVKGQVSRNFPKKKFKIILPAGHVLESDLFPEAIDEFAIHSSWSDRSFLRETLASEFMTAADVLGAQQAFPIRVERNNQFYGLYTYVEQPDGSWRDRYAVDESEIYEVGPDNVFGLLDAADANRSQASLRVRYEKETFEYLNDAKLRDFIATVNWASGATEREWIMQNVDVPSVVNALATSMVIQHQDWGHKNYRLVFGPSGLVGVTQNDYDLSYGRRWSNTSGALDTQVFVGGAFEHPGGPFFQTFFFDPQLSEMIKRRIRTLTEELFEPGAMSTRVQQLAAQVRPDAVADRAVWGTYGGSADPTAEATRLVDSFVRPQYQRLLGTMASQGRVARTSQPSLPAVTFTQVRWEDAQHVVVRNNSGDSVDISGFTIPELEFTVPGGTVLLPGRSAVFVHEDANRLAGNYPGLLIAGVFGESLDDTDGHITLRNRRGDLVTEYRIVPPGSMTTLSAEANRSALVSLVATDTTAPGFLQMVPCDVDPGETSNLNVDGIGQIRAVLALARFDSAGTACVFNLMATHVVADLQGYFAASAIDDIDDDRLLDTRGGPKPAAGSLITISNGRPDTTGLVSLVSTEANGAGFFSVVDCAHQGEVKTSNLNYDYANKIVASLTFARFDANGRICVFTSNASHLVADVQGYLTTAAFDDIVDERLIDTRLGVQPPPQTVIISGRPNTTGVISVVATNTSGAGWLQVLPCGATPGDTSNVNFDRRNAIVNGLATVRFGADGTACIFASAPTQVVVDLQGYFTDGAFDDIVDDRLVDSRQ